MKQTEALPPKPADRSALAVEAYLAQVPEPAQSTLRTIRARIRAVLPAEATEALSYGMPAFLYPKAIVGYAAFKQHCSFFPMSGSVIQALAADLQAYQTSKGTIRFPVDKPLPAALIRKIVKARLSEVESKSKAVRGNNPPKKSAPKRVVL